MFKNRQEGGRQLLAHLKAYDNAEQTIVIGLPRGGVVTASEVAKGLHLPLDVMCPRKIGAPFNPELAIGAITEEGQGFLNRELIARLAVTEEHIQKTMAQEKQRAAERLKLYRQSYHKLPLQNKVVILVDDGLATGATMKAAIFSAKDQAAQKIVVAIPVAPPDTLLEIEAMADEVVCAHTPRQFYAVGQFYQEFEQVEDGEVIALLQEAQKYHPTTHPR